MLHSAIQDPTWCQAITLTERLALLRSDQFATNPTQTDSELAGQRFQRWRSQTPFVAESTFAKRLAINEMSSDEFLCLLGEPVQVIHQRLPQPPKWLVEIAEAYSRSEAAINTEAAAQTAPNQGVLGFLGLIEPLIRRAHKGLHDGVRELVEHYPAVPFDPRNIETIFLSSLPRVLITLLSRTMTLEVNVARMLGQLAGESSAARFNDFLARLRQPDTALVIMREYPVLARQIVIRINNWLDVTLEFLQRLCADWDEIRSNFITERDPGVLVQVEAGMSDSHRGGHSVFILTFSSGFQLVYKPKSLGIDVHFQELLNWLNERTDSCRFPTFKIIDRGTYGWTEFIAAQDCVSIDELKRFYQRQGMFLALLYTLEATDFHYENLIAAGEYPTPIDLESLFHARTEELDSTEARAAYHSMDNSVLRVGLMPQRLRFNGDDEGVDLSGIGGSPGQLTPHEIPYFEDVGTDEIHLTRKRVAMAGGNNRPRLNGEEVNPLDYREEISAGFTSIYRLLMQHREELLAPDGPMSRFADDEVRYIIRPTRTYSLLLNESFHPDVLRNALDRDRFFDRLWLGSDERPYLSKVISAEIEDLQCCDVPIFTSRPNSRDIWTSSNRCISGFLKDSGMALVRKRIEQLSNADLERQLWFVNASLMTLDVESDGARWGAYELIEPAAQATDKELIAAACAIGDRLESLAMVSDNQDVSWMGVALLNEKHWSMLPMGIDLYNGLPGIALFLAYLGAITGNDRYKNLANATINAIRRNPRHVKAIKSSLGGFTGLGGWIFVLTHLSCLWKLPELLVEAESLVESLPPLIEKDEQLDFLGGAAGLISALIGLHRCAPSERTLAVAKQAGDHLLARAQKMDQGLGWATSLSEKPLAGFSHGAAGISYALLSLSEMTGEDQFRQAALEGMAYERSMFSSQLSNWPDLRKLEDAGTLLESDPAVIYSMFAWCHGAPGVGLARLCALAYVDDEAIREEIEAALNATLSNGFGRNHSLCHGDFGNIELILRAGRTLNDSDWQLHTRHVASIVLDSIKRHGWLCGIPLGVESPGLMTGLAGIGFGLLRLAKPDHVPSPLVLDPPSSI